MREWEQTLLERQGRSRGWLLFWMAVAGASWLLSVILLPLMRHL